MYYIITYLNMRFINDLYDYVIKLKTEIYEGLICIMKV